MAACKMKRLESEKINRLNNEIENTEKFQSKADMKQTIRSICYGDLYVIGRLYTESLKKVLTGAKINLLPTLHASSEPEPPKRPPKMKYTDLPLYPDSPHSDYKEWLEKSSKCPDSNKKLMNEAMFPSIRQARCSAQKFVDSFVNEVKLTFNEVSRDLVSTLKEVTKVFRSPEKELERQVFVTLGGFTGLFLARKRGIPTKLFCTSLGLLATGALCFPKETDQTFRTVLHHVGKNGLCLYNCWFGANASFRERVPCTSDLPKKVEYPSEGNQCKSKA